MDVNILREASRRISLKGLKMRRDHDGVAIASCRVLFDQVAVVYYTDDDWGGPVRIDNLNPALMPQLQDFVDTLPPDSEEGKTTLELLVSALIDVERLEKKILKDLAGKVLFRLPKHGSGEYGYFLVKHEIMRAQTERYALQKYPQAVLANRNSIREFTLQVYED